LLLGLVLPVLSLSIGGDKTILQCAPRFVAALLFTSAAAFFLAGARQFQGLVAVSAVSGIVSGLAFQYVASLRRATNDEFGKASDWLAQFSDKAEAHSFGWWALGIGTSLLLLGAVSGLVRQADRFEAPGKITFLQLVAAICVIIIGIGVFAPLTYEARRATPPEEPAGFYLAPVVHTGSVGRSTSLLETSPNATQAVVLVGAASMVAIGAAFHKYLPLSAMLTGFLAAVPVWKVITVIDDYVYDVHWTGGSCLLGGCVGLTAVFAIQRAMQSDETPPQNTVPNALRRLQVVARTYFLLATVTWYGLFTASMSLRADIRPSLLFLSLVGVGITLSVEARFFYRWALRIDRNGRGVRKAKDHPSFAEMLSLIVRRILPDHGLWMLAIPIGAVSIFPSFFMGIGPIAIWLLGGLLCALGFALSFHGPLARVFAGALILLAATYAFVILHFGRQLFWNHQVMSKSYGLLPASLWALLLWLALTLVVLRTVADKGRLSARMRLWRKWVFGSA
jgi:hypothetical protein